MKKSIILLFITIILVFSCKKESNKKVEVPDNLSKNIQIIDKDENKGFHWPYFIYIPDEIKIKKTPIIVTTNNSNSSDNYIEVYNHAMKKFLENIGIAKDLGIPMIMCALPRYRNKFPSDLHKENDAWIVNVQALTRNSMLTNDPLLKRIDIQVTKIIDDAKIKIENRNLKINEKVIMYGFSASGDFSNRFSLIHPERVDMIISGDPSDWYTVPIDKYNNKTLRYPIGIYDFKEITGKEFNRDEYNKINKFFFTGTEDNHNPLLYVDNIDYEDRVLFIDLFGDDIIKKYKENIKIFEDNNCKVEFKLYKDIGHEFTDEMKEDIKIFIRNNS